MAEENKFLYKYDIVVYVLSRMLNYKAIITWSVCFCFDKEINR